MGFMHRLCETYDNARGTDAFDGESPLVPTGFKYEKPDVIVHVDSTGTFVQAIDWSKSKTEIVVPTTLDAENRTSSKSAPYPLCDKLFYVAGDLAQNQKGGSVYYRDYMQQLGAWCAQKDTPQELKCVFHYLEKKTLAADLAGQGIKVKEDKKVCFDVDNGRALPLWEMPELRQSWEKYRHVAFQQGELCYISGQMAEPMGYYPKFSGNAKLISADDSDNPMQYKGRFENNQQALSVGEETAVKAHNALRWLLKKQSFQRFGMMFLAWSTGGEPVINPCDTSDGFDEDEDEKARTPHMEVEEAYGQRVAKAIAGYAQKLTHSPSTVVMLGLEAATPGRMSVTYYQELGGREYIDRLAMWYQTCCFTMSMKGADGTWAERWFTPNMEEIALAVYGSNTVNTAKQDMQAKKSATKMVRSLYYQLLQTIIGRRNLPDHVVQMAFRRAIVPLRFTRQQKWDSDAWKKALSVTCALIRRKEYEQKRGGAINVTLESKLETVTDRDFLYGRLLSVAHQAEMRAMEDYGRQTNAIRYMQIFQQRPNTTWTRLALLLIPYYRKLGKTASRYQILVDAIGAQIDLTDHAPLSPQFLEGFYCQNRALMPKKKEDSHEYTQAKN